MGEDLGTQIAPIISLELYRKTIRPLHQRFVDLARSFDIHTMIHTCGSSSWAYEDFIEMGISVVDTLQPEVKDMSPAYSTNITACRVGTRLPAGRCVPTNSVRSISAGRHARPTKLLHPGRIGRRVRRTSQFTGATTCAGLNGENSCQ